MSPKEELILLPIEEYVGVDRDDPIRHYQKPVFGPYYKRRVELCLQECRGGERVLEVGFGTGVAFLNLARKYKEVHGIDLKSNIEEITALFASKGLDVFLKSGTLLHLPYENDFFDTILLVSILEHLQPADLDCAFQEIRRVLKPGGQLVYGIPVDNRITRMGFLLLGYDITRHHFSSERQVEGAAIRYFQQMSLSPIFLGLGVKVYEVGNYIKA